MSIVDLLAIKKMGLILDFSGIVILENTLIILENFMSRHLRLLL